MKKSILLLLISLGFSSCEKDDICAADTPTTPNVVIEFFDNTSNLLTAVPNMAVSENGSETVYKTFNDSKIKIPLKTDLDLVKYKFVLNANLATKNTDYLEFNYSRNNVFISRACGFKTVFTLNTNSPTHTDAVIPDTKWIKRIEVSKPSILNENETHIKIYF
jgi:Family of unknown function (DUF6452)